MAKDSNDGGRAKLVQDWVEAHRKRDAAAIEKLASEKLSVQGAGFRIEGRAAYLESQAAVWENIPEQDFATEELITSADAVVLRWLDRANHKLPTGERRKVITPGCSIFRFEGASISEITVYADGVDVLRQLCFGT